MELARFIDARVGEGMSKQDVAKKLRRPLHDITYLQALHNRARLRIGAIQVRQVPVPATALPTAKAIRSRSGAC